MKIVYKNGYEHPITQGVANVIRDHLLKGCDDFQCFSDEYGMVYLIVNLSEVACITESRTK